MERKKYDRKSARGILTLKERDFLNKLKDIHHLTSNERMYLASIRNKTTKGLQDLTLIFEKLPEAYLLFNESGFRGLQKPVEEITKTLYYENYWKEFRERSRRKTKRQVNKKVMSQKTKKELNEIIDSVLEKLQ